VEFKHNCLSRYGLHRFCLKYQIPVSGVQTQVTGKRSKAYRRLKYQIPVSGVQTPLPFGSGIFIPMPEIPDSSKWSSNLKIILVQAASGKPEIPDSSKWSSNIHVLKGRFSYDVA